MYRVVSFVVSMDFGQSELIRGKLIELKPSTAQTNKPEIWKIANANITQMQTSKQTISGFDILVEYRTSLVCSEAPLGFH